jgi:formylglycine-generating enzyme required for sulfatase activity
VISQTARLTIQTEKQEPFPGMVWIPAGMFIMGSPASETARLPNEGPQTQVKFTKGFWMGKYEVTQVEYLAVMGINPSKNTGDTLRPVENVDWHDAGNFCAKLTVRERAAKRLPSGYVYRLPTEAEWEYACRAGTTTRFSYGDDSDYTQLGNYAWYSDNSGLRTHPVGQKKPNEWGLYDMHGNVWEWCLDGYGESLPGGSVTDPRAPNTTGFYAFRGNSENSEDFFCRSACRVNNFAYDKFGNWGFRLALARE